MGDSGLNDLVGLEDASKAEEFLQKMESVQFPTLPELTKSKTLSSDTEDEKYSTDDEEDTSRPLKEKGAWKWVWFIWKLEKDTLTSHSTSSQDEISSFFPAQPSPPQRVTPERAQKRKRIFSPKKSPP